LFHSLLPLALYAAVAVCFVAAAPPQDLSCPTYKSCRYFLDQEKRYTCVLEDVDHVISAIGGNHSAGFNDSSVTRIYFINSKLSKVPDIIFTQFVNVNYLSVTGTQMTILNDNTFKTCSAKLKTLDARDNLISRVIKTALQKCTELESLDLHGNPVEDLDMDIFQYNPKLTKLIVKRRILFR